MQSMCVCEVETKQNIIDKAINLKIQSLPMTNFPESRHHHSLSK